jgi:hypothetical protein
VTRARRSQSARSRYWSVASVIGFYSKQRPPRVATIYGLRVWLLGGFGPPNQGWF